MRNREERAKNRGKNCYGKNVLSYIWEESKQGGKLNFETGLQGFPLSVLCEELWY